jgi:colanic acid/amylovoran biosynthesis glycosyltransferase
VIDVRVLFATYGYPDDGQAFIERYVCALAALGTDVCVVATAGPRRRPPSETGVEGRRRPRVLSASWEDGRIRKLVTLCGVLGGAVRHQPGALRRIVTRVWRDRGFGRTFLSRLYVLVPIVSQPTDVVHLGWLTSAADWLELLDAVEVPLVVSCHGSDLRIDPIDDDEYRARVGRVFARADLVHCVSEDLARRAVALGADPDRVFVRAWGADTDFFSPACPPDLAASDASVAIQIVSVGRLHWVKGYEFALSALAQLRRTGTAVEYTIIGDGKARDRLAVLATIRDLDLEDHVHLTGARTPDQVLAALRGADVFLLSSLSEGMSTVTLEAMSAGVPVVVTDVGGMREAVTDGVEGRVVPPRDPAALAAAICELAADEQLRATMGGRARQRALEAFDSRATARLMVERYRLLIDHRRGRPAGSRRTTRRAIP